MTKSQGRQNKKNAGYYTKQREKTTLRKARAKVVREKRLKEIASGVNLGSTNAIKRRAQFVADKANKAEKDRKKNERAHAGTNARQQTRL